MTSSKLGLQTLEEDGAEGLLASALDAQAVAAALIPRGAVPRWQNHLIAQAGVRSRQPLAADLEVVEPTFNY